MSEKRIVRRSVAIALGITCIVLIAGIGGVMAYYTMQINNKTSTYNDYVSTHIHTDSDYNSLNSSLNSQIVTLTNENNQLQAWLNGNITSYDSQIVTLTNENNQLQAWLNGNITSYDSQINSLQSSNTQLQTIYQNLQSAYNQLYNQYQLLLSELPSSPVLTIDSIITQSVFITPSGVYNVTVRNHNSSDVHVTSLKLYRGTILAASAALFVTIPANSSVTINQYLPWDEVSPGNIYILKVETLEGYNATSDPLSNG